MDIGIDAPAGSPRKHPVWVTLALIQGISAPILFFLVAFVGGLLRPGYSHVSQAISELTEAGAVNKVYLDLALLVMEVLTILFGLGFYWVVRTASWRLRSSAALMVLIGSVGLLFYRYPMDPMGTDMTPDGRMHLIIVTVSAVAAILGVLLSARGWASVSGGRGIARMCYVVLAAMLFSGVAAALVGSQGLPGIGIWQRINTGAFSAWQIATAIYLLRPGVSEMFLDTLE